MELFNIRKEGLAEERLRGKTPRITLLAKANASGFFPLVPTGLRRGRRLKISLNYNRWQKGLILTFSGLIY
jgi:hypothetical protein